MITTNSVWDTKNAALATKPIYVFAVSGQSGVAGPAGQERGPAAFDRAFFHEVLPREREVPELRGHVPDHLLQAGGLAIRRDESGRLPADASLFEIVADYERRGILEHLEAAGWSQTDAAATLRVSLSTLNQKIKRLNLEIRRKSDAARAERVS